MASFLKGFVKGAMDTYNAGYDDEVKNQQAMERDADRIIAEGIIRNANEMKANLRPALQKNQEVFKKYKQGLELFGGNERAAEVFANSDVKGSDFKKIHEIAATYGDAKDYKATLPADLMANEQALRGQAGGAYSAANKLVGKSKRFGGMTPYQAEPVDSNAYVIKAPEGGYTALAKPDPTPDAIDTISKDPQKFGDMAGAVAWVNGKRKMAGLEGLPLSSLAPMLKGLQWGGTDPADERRKASIRGYYTRNYKNDLTPEQIEDKVIEAMYPNVATGNRPLTIDQAKSWMNDASKAIDVATGTTMVMDAGGNWVFSVGEKFKGEPEAKIMRARVIASELIRLNQSHNRPPELSPQAYGLHALKLAGVPGFDSLDAEQIKHYWEQLIHTVKSSTLPTATSTNAGTPTAQPTGSATPPPAITKPGATTPTAGADKEDKWKDGQIIAAPAGNIYGVPEGTPLKNEKGKPFVWMNGKWVAPATTKAQ